MERVQPSRLRRDNAGARDGGPVGMSGNMTTGITSVFINRIDKPPAFPDLRTDKFRTSHKLGADRVERIAIVFSY